MGNNSDFQSELLRINGLLQASITELRYRCEVYRLSLRSIGKVLANVQKEHGSHLRCLTTSRPSYQAYLLNLSQKQALDRIGKVVRKASTFINGYSLVDKGLFQPPPPKPSTLRQEKTASASPTTIAVATLMDSSRSSQMAPTPQSCSNESSTQIVSLITTYGAENKVDAEKAGTASSKNKTRKGNESQQPKTKSETKNEKGTQQSSKFAKKHTHDGRRSRTDDGRDESKRRSEKEKTSKSPKITKSTERSGPTCSTKQTTSKPCANRSRPISKHYSYATTNGSIKRLGSFLEIRKYTSGAKQSNNKYNLSVKQNPHAVKSEKLRAEARRAQRGRPSQEEDRRGVTSAGYKDGRSEKNRSGIRATHLKEIHDNEANKTRYKFGEKFTVVRNRSSAATIQGQGVTRKCLCSSHKLQTNFKLSFGATEEVRRIQVNRKSEESERSSRKVANSLSICGGSKNTPS